MTEAQKFDLFISYAKEDQEWVKGYLLNALDQAGVTYLTEAAFELGGPRLLAFEAAIQQSQRILLVVSPAYLLEGYNRFVDLLVTHFGLEAGTWPVIPLILKPVARLPPHLAILVRIEITDEHDWEPALKRLATTLAQPLALPLPPPRPPYPGMRSYTEADSQYFYGRKVEIDALIKLLHQHRFLTLIGHSGCGKSSLIFAGLIPTLRKSMLFAAGKWLVRALRPGINPLSALSTALAGDPRQAESTVATLFASAPEVRNLLIVVDQLEELFVLAEGEARPFQEALVHLAAVPNTYVILAVRADFYPNLMISPIWSEIKNHNYPLLPLDEKGLTAAIVQPAEQVGVYVEAALVERLVADAGNEPGILPFVQETMRLLWDKLERRYLPLRAYETLVLPRSAVDDLKFEQVTGLRAAMAMHAMSVFSKLHDEQERAIAQRIFTRLVQFGEGRAHTRRQQVVSQLCGSTDPALFARVLNQLANEESRLLILGGEERGPEREVDIAHEALISAWPDFQKWLAKQRQAEEFRRDFVADVKQWQQRQENAFFLYEGAKLQEALVWAAENPEEIDKTGQQQKFLQVSKKRDRQRQRRQFFLRSVVILFALTGIVATGYFAYLAYLNYTARGLLVNFPAGSAPLGPDRHQVVLPAFSLDKYEVTNRQYRLCIAAGVCLRPSEPAEYSGIDNPANDHKPVVWVNAYQAAIFCRWIGRRLPTQAEWERAVRGSEGRTWPWGEAAPTLAHVNMLLPELANSLQSGHSGELNDATAPDASSPDLNGLQAGLLGSLVAVDDPAFVSGSTPGEGITHLLGNAGEWSRTPSTCADPYSCLELWDGNQKIAALNIIGGSWADDLLSQEMQIVTEPLPAQLIHFADTVGFRCAR